MPTARAPWWTWLSVETRVQVWALLYRVTGRAAWWRMRPENLREDADRSPDTPAVWAAATTPAAVRRAIQTRGVHRAQLPAVVAALGALTPTMVTDWVRWHSGVAPVVLHHPLAAPALRRAAIDALQSQIIDELACDDWIGASVVHVLRDLAPAVSSEQIWSPRLQRAMEKWLRDNDRWPSGPEMWEFLLEDSALPAPLLAAVCEACRSMLVHGAFGLGASSPAAQQQAGTVFGQLLARQPCPWTDDEIQGIVSRCIPSLRSRAVLPFLPPRWVARHWTSVTPEDLPEVVVKLARRGIATPWVTDAELTPLLAHADAAVRLAAVQLLATSVGAPSGTRDAACDESPAEALGEQPPRIPATSPSTRPLPLRRTRRSLLG